MHARCRCNFVTSLEWNLNIPFSVTSHLISSPSQMGIAAWQNSLYCRIRRTINITVVQVVNDDCVSTHLHFGLSHPDNDDDCDDDVDAPSMPRNTVANLVSSGSLCVTVACHRRYITRTRHYRQSSNDRIDWLPTPNVYSARVARQPNFARKYVSPRHATLCARVGFVPRVN